MHQYIKGLFFILGLFIPLLSFSQQYNFRNYSVDQGLAQSQVYAMCEDNTGNIWFGTRGGGLSRFDGIHFTNYTTQEGLADNYVKTIIKDPKGNLWIGTDNGLSKYDGKAFYNFNAKQGLYSTAVNALVFDKLGTLWIGTQNGIFQMQKDTIVRFGRKLGVPIEKINCLVQDKNNVIWAGSDFGILQFTNTNNKEWSMNLITTKEGLPVNLITSITPLADGEVLVTTYGGGVVKLGSDGIKTVITKKEGLNSNTVYSCLVDGQNIWCATAFGVNKLIVEDNRDSIISITETEGIANNVVMCLLKDSFGNTWFGTSGGGVSKLDSERFKHYTAIKGVFGGWVFAIYQDKQGVMWFGTSEGGVTLYDGKIYKRYSDRNGFTADKVKCITEDSKGNIWLGTIGDGLYRYDGKRFYHYTKKDGLTSKFINYILEDTNGNIWLGTAGGGINVLRTNQRIYSLKQFKNARVNTLVLGTSNTIWAGDETGELSQITFNNENDYVVQKYKTKSSSVRCATKSNSGKLYFGTADKGVLIYDGKSFINWTKFNGLVSNNIYSIIFDSHGNLWIGTDKGVDKIKLTSKGTIGSIHHYGKAEGFIGIEVIRNSTFIDRNNNVWFGTVKTASVYNSQKEKKVDLPKLHLTGINLFFDNIKNTPFGKHLSAWYSIPENMELPYDKNHLSFEFIGIEQSNPESVKYRWQLEDFDKEWSPVTSRTEAVYSNLSPGHYTFKVIASNEIGEWTEPLIYSFRIQAPFWVTWWFRILILAAILLLSLLVVFYLFKRLKTKSENERKKLEAEKNLMELEQKALRLQMNPHFLFNCLNSIKGLIAEEKSEEAKLYLSRFAKLMRSTLDNSREEFIPLELEISSLKNYVELELLSHEDQFDFVIQVKNNFDPAFIQIPPMLVQPFVENSIIHGLVPKDSKGHLLVIFDKETEYIKCTIEDNGIGRSKSEDRKDASVYAHKSSAIAVTQERLNSMNKKLNLKEIMIKFIDLVDEENHPIGTKVELFIPYIEL